MLPHKKLITMQRQCETLNPTRDAPTGVWDVLRHSSGVRAVPCTACASANARMTR